MQFGCGLFILIIGLGALGQFLWNIHPIVLFAAIALVLWGLGKWLLHRKQLKDNETAAQASAERLAYVKTWKPASDTLARDSDRDLAVEFLHAGHEDGRLTTEDLNQRLGLAMAAKTHGDLAAAVRGLLG